MRSDQSSVGEKPDVHQVSVAQRKYPDRRFQYDGDWFCSRSEAACGALMEKYLPFKLRDGKTFQVPIGRNEHGDLRRVDFVVCGAVFEYHPFRPPRDPQYWKMLARFAPGEREEFRTRWSENAAQHYYDTRRAQLDENPRFRDKELIVARTPEEFYEKIVCRFMQERKKRVSLPEREAFLAEFQKILEQVYERETKRQARRVRVGTWQAN